MMSIPSRFWQQQRWCSASCLKVKFKVTMLPRFDSLSVGQGQSYNVTSIVYWPCPYPKVKVKVTMLPWSPRVGWPCPCQSPSCCPCHQRTWHWLDCDSTCAQGWKTASYHQQWHQQLTYTIMTTLLYHAIDSMYLSLIMFEWQFYYPIWDMDEKGCTPALFVWAN